MTVTQWVIRYPSKYQQPHGISAISFKTKKAAKRYYKLGMFKQYGCTLERVNIEDIK